MCWLIFILIDNGVKIVFDCIYRPYICCIYWFWFGFQWDRIEFPEYLTVHAVLNYFHFRLLGTMPGVIAYEMIFINLWHYLIENHLTLWKFQSLLKRAETWDRSVWNIRSWRLNKWDIFFFFKLIKTIRVSLEIDVSDYL